MKPRIKKENQKRTRPTKLELRLRLKELQRENEYLRTYISIFKQQLMAELEKIAG